MVRCIRKALGIFFDTLDLFPIIKVVFLRIGQFGPCGFSGQKTGRTPVKENVNFVK